MNICIICPEIGESGGSAFIGGHVNNVVELIKKLADKGHEIDLITTPHRHRGDGVDFIYDGINIHTIEVPGAYLSIRYGINFVFKSIKMVRNLNHKKKFDIIHGHSGYTMPAMITSIAAKISGLPSIHTVYSPITVASGYVVKYFSNNTLSRFYLSWINSLIVVTENARSSLIKAGVNGDKINKIPLGINTELYKPKHSNIREEYGIKSDEFLLIYVGNMTIQKGISVLIDALKMVVSENPNIKLFMVLNMPLERYNHPTTLEVDMPLTWQIKEKIKDYGLDDNIIPLGLLNNLEDYMAASDINIVPFLDTVGIVDYPTSMIEFMAIGKPIIATDVGGIPEIVKNGKNGMIIEKNNPKKLADAILHMVKNKKQSQSMGEESLKIIHEEFDVDIVTEEMEKLYKRVISDYSGN